MPTSWADELTTAPSVEPVTLFEVKRYCDEDDTHRDADYESWLVEARKAVEHDARVALVNQTRTHYLHRFPSNEQLKLNVVSPLSSVTSVQYQDVAGSTQTLATTVYKVDTARKPGCLWLKKGQCWPDVYDEANAVWITYVAGYGSTAASVPEWAKAAIKIYVKHRLEHPELVADGRMSELPESYSRLIGRLHPGTYP